ncbi:MAG: RNA-binding S4 domain-containing protein [Pseudomonadota bacterium]|jgi:ribosome-associated heat shock protein Hsp15
MNGKPEAAGVRIDVWLWAARMFRTRSLAKVSIEAGRVRIDGVACKPSRLVRVGDRVAVSRGGEAIEFVVAALSDQRGPAPVAQAFYAETTESRVAREAERERRRLRGAGCSAPAARPDKRARREILRLIGEA